MRFVFWTAAFVVALVFSVSAGLAPRAAAGLGVVLAFAAGGLVLRQRSRIAEVIVVAALGAYVGARAMV